MEINKIYKVDCVDIINRFIDEESVDLIFANPPYNLSGNSLNLKNNKTGGAFYKVNEDWDTYNYNDYIGFY